MKSIVFGLAFVFIALWALYALFGSREAGSYVSVVGVAAAIYGYLFNAAKERGVRSVESRKQDYSDFLDRWFTANVKLQGQEIDPLTEARLRLLLFGSKKVVLALKDLIKKEVGDSSKKASNIGFATEFVQIVNAMRKDVEQDELSMDDVLWVVQKEGSP